MSLDASYIPQEVEVPYERFKELKNQSSGISGFSIPIFEHIYLFTKEYPDQKNYYRIVGGGEDEYTQDAISEYLSFGIIIGENLAIDVTKRRYLLIVDGTSESDEETYARSLEFINNYLPRGAKPHHFVVDVDFEHFSEMDLWHDRMDRLFPGIVKLADYSYLLKEKHNEVSFSLLLQEAKDVGMEPFVLDEYVTRLKKVFVNGNVGTLREFMRIESEILSKIQGKNDVVLMSNTEYTISACVAAYMFYKHKIPCHFSPSSTSRYLNNLSSLLFDRDKMLVEEQIEYIKRLPDIAVSFDRSNLFEFFVFLEKAKMSCRLKVFYTDLDAFATDSVHMKEFDIHDINVIPLENEFPLGIANLGIFEETHRNLLNLITAFETKCDTRGTELFTVSNIFFMEHEGSKKIAYLDSIDLNLPAIYFPLNQDLPKFQETITADQVRTIYPINMFPGYKTAFRPFMEEISLAYAKVKGGNGRIPLSANFYRHSHAMGLIIDTFYAHKSNKLEVNDFNDFLTLGLWWRETHTYRVKLIHTFDAYMDVKKARLYNTFFSVFGGPFPLFSSRLILREEFLKEW